ncbi:MAG TPA: carbohydrate ABC transporter permease, partial [Chthonomonadaceae bacterium]|nr:carbohydrate ABC transporter permease [Chthonomonadaceae bacterium]
MRQRHAWLIHLVLIVMSFLFAFPLLWMLSTSLKPISQTMSDKPVWIPHPIQWRNYYDAIAYQHDVLGYYPFLVYARNTVVLCILTVSGTVASCSIVAYSFARLRWPGRDLLFAATLATMMVPFPVLMVPIYGLYRNAGWVGTFRPLWVQAWFGG